VGSCKIWAVDRGAYHVSAAVERESCNYTDVASWHGNAFGCRYQPRTVFAGSVSLQFAVAHAAEQVAAIAQVIIIPSPPST
jgi:hypothetical protein